MVGRFCFWWPLCEYMNMNGCDCAWMKQLMPISWCKCNFWALPQRALCSIETTLWLWMVAWLATCPACTPASRPISAGIGFRPPPTQIHKYIHQTVIPATPDLSSVLDIVLFHDIFLQVTIKRDEIMKNKIMCKKFGDFSVETITIILYHDILMGSGCCTILWKTLHKMTA